MLGETALDINNAIINRFKLNSSDSKVLSSTFDFFSKKQNWDNLLKFLSNDSKISLRVIDYFLTTYCSQNKVEYNDLNVFIEYKNQLKKYHKKYFDPCSRGLKIPYFFNKDVCVITTICQINFFKWFIQTKIFENFISLYQDIKKSMKNKKLNRSKTNYSFNHNENNNVLYCSTSKNIMALFD